MKSYTVAGRLLCVRTHEGWEARLFGRYFSGWHVSAAAADTRAPDAAIVVRHEADPPALPAGLSTFDVGDGGRCHTDGRSYIFESRGSVVRVAEAEPTLVEVWIGREPSARTTAALARLVFNAATAAMRRCGLYDLHGGGVVEPRTGAGALIIGPSGSGKSTLTMQLAAGGWGYLSDDALLLRGVVEGVGAWPLRRVFAVAEPTIAASKLPRLAAVTTSPVPFDPHKRRFEPEALFPGGFVSDCLPRALIFPRVTGEPATRAVRLSPAEAMARLLRMCPWSCYDRPVARGHLRILSSLVGQCVAYDLFAGTELLGDVERTGAALAPLVGGAGA